jgi:hypothetical protein
MLTDPYYEYIPEFKINTVNDPALCEENAKKAEYRLQQYKAKRMQIARRVKRRLDKKKQRKLRGREPNFYENVIRKNKEAMDKKEERIKRRNEKKKIIKMEEKCIQKKETSKQQELCKTAIQQDANQSEIITSNHATETLPNSIPITTINLDVSEFFDDKLINKRICMARKLIKKALIDSDPNYFEVHPKGTPNYEKYGSNKMCAKSMNEISIVNYANKEVGCVFNEEIYKYNTNILNEYNDNVNIHKNIANFDDFNDRFSIINGIRYFKNLFSKFKQPKDKPQYEVEDQLQTKKQTIQKHLKVDPVFWAKENESSKKKK